MAKTPEVQKAVEDPLATARVEVKRLNADELRLALIYRERSVDDAEARAQRGRQVRDAGDPTAAVGEINARIRALGDELAGYAEAASEARKDRLQAIAVVFTAEADEAERKAEQLDADAATLEAESNRLRKALEAHDDWKYGSAAPTLPDVAIGGQLGGGTLTIVDARGPRHARLRGEAQGLRTQAAQGRLRQPHQAGMVEADTVEDLFALVHADAMRVGPTVDAIVGWAEKAGDTEAYRRARLASTADGFVPVDAPMRLHLEWRAGAIDQAQSRILAPDPAEVEIQEYQLPAAAVRPDSPTARRSQSAPDPYYTGPKLDEIQREAAAIGKSPEEVAEALGVAVPGMRGGVEVRNV